MEISFGWHLFIKVTTFWFILFSGLIVGITS